ncbi:MAG: hypothetical protein JWO50_363 [Candidatus Kaiserbacteria bacterium]|nr:hypothetical protein [Candidatus Kaiserbacteria bacterium]
MQQIKNCGQSKLFRAVCASLLLLILIYVLFLTHALLNTKTFLPYSIKDKLSLGQPFQQHFNGNLLGDTSHLQKIVADSHLTDNPYSYRLYAFALMARSDMYVFGRLHTDADVICLDDTIARHLYGNKVFAVTQQCSFDGLDTVMAYEQVYVTDTSAFVLHRPQGDQFWNGKRAVDAETALWSMMVPELTPAEVPKPFGFDSAEEHADIADLLTLQQTRTPDQMARILYWANQLGSIPLFFDIYHSAATSTPQVKQLHLQTIIAVAGLNGFIEAWKLKYYYWAPRPFMRSSLIKTAIPTPDFPSYPSGHATIAGSVIAALAGCGLEGEELDTIERLGQESADSREWAGIHFHTDDQNGLIIGRMIGAEVADTYCPKM